MRVIAGKHRGRKLIPPADDATRPITDRVKQSLFDRLSSADVVEGAVVLDVFAGTGSMGIECLSRGAEHVTFVEKSFDPRKKLAENLHALQEEENAQVIEGNALSPAMVDVLPKRSYTLIFLDPPYPLVADESRALRLWNVAEKIAEVSEQGATMILRTQRDQHAPELAHFIGPDSHTYGTMALHFYRRIDS
jgi:16S rRNA (guanine966-N2)-methyltransferase